MDRADLEHSNVRWCGPAIRVYQGVFPRLAELVFTDIARSPESAGEFLFLAADKQPIGGAS
jgi:hypothetical protein